MGSILDNSFGPIFMMRARRNLSGDCHILDEIGDCRGSRSACDFSCRLLRGVSKDPIVSTDRRFEQSLLHRADRDDSRMGVWMAPECADSICCRRAAVAVLGVVWIATAQLIQMDLELIATAAAGRSSTSSRGLTAGRRFSTHRRDVKTTSD